MVLILRFRKALFKSVILHDVQCAFPNRLELIYNQFLDRKRIPFMFVPMQREIERGQGWMRSHLEIKEGENGDEG